MRVASPGSSVTTSNYEDYLKNSSNRMNNQSDLLVQDLDLKPAPGVKEPELGIRLAEFVLRVKAQVRCW